jgi:hypothetical protein
LGDSQQSGQFTILDIKQDHNPPACLKKEMQKLRRKFQKKKEIDVPLSQELIVNLLVNLLALISEGILQLHSYWMPIRASPLLRSDQVQGQKRVLLN